MIPHSRPAFGVEEKRAVEALLESGQIAQGEKVAQFESVLSEFTGRRYGVAVSSGTAALQLSLLALGISSGDEVIFPSYTCVALLHAVEAVRARPVLVDIEADDFNLSIAEVNKKIGRKTKAVIVPHLFGRPAEIEALRDLKIPVLEDGTQALGAVVGGKPVGSFGTVSLFSFYATKMIATGEGGMVLTDSRPVARRLQDLRDYDKKETYRFRTNSKMTDLEAALGIEQMKKLPQFIARRREIARAYDEAFRTAGFVDSLTPTLSQRERGKSVRLPPFYPLPRRGRGEGEGARAHVYYRYVVRVPRKAKERLEQFAAHGIDVKRPIYKPVHRYLGLSDSLFPETSRAMKEALSIPIYPSLAEEALDKILRLIGQGASQTHPLQAAPVSV